MDKIGIQVQGEEPEERAQYIFALGNPGNGLDMQWVQRKEGSDKCTWPSFTGDFLQEKKQQKGVDNV